jgi:multidrug efflux pump subunit AcrB
LVDNIQHIESTSYNDLAIVKIYLQPNYSIDTANAQVTAASQLMLRRLPPGTQPPLVINFSASSVPILQLGPSGQGMSEQQLNDLGLNFLRTQLVTVPGSVIPYPYGGKQRQVMINLNPSLLAVKRPVAISRVELGGNAVPRAQPASSNADIPAKVRRIRQPPPACYAPAAWRCRRSASRMD